MSPKPDDWGSKERSETQPAADGHGTCGTLEMEKTSPGGESHQTSEVNLGSCTVVLGAFALVMSTWGMMNTVGIFQAYWLEHQLSEYSPSAIGWIPSTFIALNLALALYIGQLFDKFGPRWLLMVGSTGYAVAFFILGSCTKYWQFLLVFGVLGGSSGAVISIPAVGALARWFFKHRGIATGLAFTGAGAGGVVFPLMLRSLLPSLGWAWATRVLAFVVTSLLVVGNVCVRGRSNVRNVTWKLDFRCFRDMRFIWASLAYSSKSKNSS